MAKPRGTNPDGTGKREKWIWPDRKDNGLGQGGYDESRECRPDIWQKRQSSESGGKTSGISATATLATQKRIRVSRGKSQVELKNGKEKSKALKTSDCDLLII